MSQTTVNLLMLYHRFEIIVLKGYFMLELEYIVQIDLSHNDVKRGKPDVTQSLIGLLVLWSESYFV